MIRAMSSKKKARLKKAVESGTGGYRNCDFILGSAAVVERLWSTCKYILTENRSNLDTATFEEIIYLSLNRDLWDLEDSVALLRKKDDNTADDAEQVAV